MRFAPIAAILALAGCALTRTHYTRPELPTPETYAHADALAKAALDHWWRAFDDPSLDALVEDVLKRNTSLAIAALHVREAELATHLAVINPTVSVGYTYDYAKPLTGHQPSTQFHSLTAAASYEVDLWGALGATRDAAKWEARATEEDRESAALALIGTTVDLYYQLALLNQEIASGEASLSYMHRTRDLVESLLTYGGATQLDLAQADQAVATQGASQAGLIEQRTETRNALATLLDATAWARSEPTKIPDDPPPSVDAGLPAALIDRRPDLRAAEQRLREALATTDATRLSFYPNLTLTGGVGTATTELSQLVENPIGTLAASLGVPFVQIDEAHFATALARTRYEEASISFRQTALRALTDVDNALSSRTQLTLQAADLERALRAARTAEHLNEVLYRHGVVPLRTWLAAQESRRQAEIALAAMRLAQLQNFATLCQALGGAPKL